MAAEPSAHERVTAKATPAAAMACTKADSRVAAERGGWWGKERHEAAGVGPRSGGGGGCVSSKDLRRRKSIPKEIPPRAQEEMLDVTPPGEEQGWL